MQLKLKREKMMEKAVKFLRDTEGKPGTVAQKIEFLKSKGLTDNDIVEAMNAATNGTVVQTAVPDLH